MPTYLQWLLPKAYSAAAFWPIVIIRNLEMAQPHIINHEQIHLKQQIELGLIIFYLVYFSEYLYYRIKGKNHNDAYMAISFEKEAYQFEHNFDYLKKRKFWSQWRKSNA